MCGAVAIRNFIHFDFFYESKWIFFLPKIFDLNLNSNWSIINFRRLVNGNGFMTLTYRTPDAAADAVQQSESKYCEISLRCSRRNVNVYCTEPVHGTIN